MTTRAKNEAAATPFEIIQGTDERPDLKITTDVHVVAARAADLLGEHDPGVFRYGGKLVHVLPGDPVRVGHRPPPRISELHPYVLINHLSRSMRWIRYAPAAKLWKHVPPPMSFVSSISKMGKWPTVKQLIGVITTPTLRPDGSIFQIPGYDEATSLLFIPNESFVEVPERPTIEDAKGAAEAILDVVCDFPFARDADRSAWLAAVLTMVSRHAIDGPVPLFAITSTTPGTGKSRLVDLASLIAHGTQAPRTPCSTQEEETRKTIASILLDGSPCALWDNAKSGSKFGGPSIDALLTSTEWKDRVLGKSETSAIPATCVWFVTGNNIRFSDDLTRRTLHIRLETNDASPEDREGFKHGSGGELFDHVERKRKFLVASALTILRAHALAGRPSSRVWGSFEKWSRVVGNAITWIGHEDPLVTKATADEGGSDDKILIGALARALIDVARPVTSRELISELYPASGYDGAQGSLDMTPSFVIAREVIDHFATDPRKGKADAIKLGHIMKRIRGRVIVATNEDGSAVSLKVDGEVDKHTKITKWIGVEVTT